MNVHNRDTHIVESECRQDPSAYSFMNGYTSSSIYNKVEYYPPIKRVQIWIHVTICRNLKSTLNEKVILLIGIAQNEQLCHKKWISGCLGVDCWWQGCAYTKTWRVLSFFFRVMKGLALCIHDSSWKYFKESFPLNMHVFLLSLVHKDHSLTNTCIALIS